MNVIEPQKRLCNVYIVLLINFFLIDNHFIKWCIILSNECWLHQEHVREILRRVEMNALTLQEIIDRIPVHKNIHKSDVVAYCDENRSHAQVLYFPLGYLDFLREKLNSSKKREDIEMSFIAQLLEKRYGKPFDLSNDYANWAECCKAFSCFLDDYNFSLDEKLCVDKLASKYDFTLVDAWFFLEAMKYRPNSKIEVSAADREVINLYYKIGSEDLDGIYHLLDCYLGLGDQYENLA